MSSTKDLEDLKSIFEIPRLHISNYFTDLRAEIDLAFIKDNNDQNCELWNEMIEIVNKHEKECLKKITKNKFSEQSTVDFMQKIDLIETNIKNQIETKALIEDEKFKIEKMLFLNQTLIFLDVNNYKNMNLLKRSHLFKLIAISDEFISKNGIDTLKK